MNTKIGTSFGLALLLALGVLATMLALGLFSSSKAEADVDVSGIQLAKTTPGDNTQITIFFSHQSNLTAGSGQILVTFDATWGVPTTIKREHVTLTTFQTSGGTSNPAIDPSVVVGANSTVVTLTIGDTAPATADTQSMFPQVISGVPVAGATPHILVFSPLAGITNPLSQGDELTSWICVTTSVESISEGAAACPTTGNYVPLYYTFTSPSTTGFLVPRKVSLSATSGANGTSVTATGKGYVTGTVTAFLDNGTDDGHTVAAGGHTAASHAAGSALGAYDASTDVDLGTSAAIVSGGVATVTFTASVPTLARGLNIINLKDGLGSIATTANDGEFTMIGSVTTDKTSVKRGESLVVKLRQFFDGAVTSLTIGGTGVNVTTCCATAIGDDNSIDYTVTVPTTTPLGTQRLAVIVAGESTSSRNVNIDVVGAPLTLSPTTAVPDQEITISGQGFTVGGAATIPAGSATCTAAGVTVGGTCATTTNSLTTIDNSGNFVLTLKVPDNSTTRTAGSYKVEVKDNSSATGSQTLVIPSRVLTLGSSSGLRGATVSFTGTGFAAKSTVTLTYKVSDASSPAVASASADSSGNISGSFTVPTTATIPSTNVVTASATGSSGTAGTATANHSVPAATVTVAQASAAPGTNITVSGTGFPGFASMTVLNIGGVAAIPTPAPSSDTNGAFTATVLVPQLSLGTQAVSVTVGAIVGTTSLTIVAAAVVPVVTTTATGTVFAEVVSNADNLVRVWRYSNATQAWAFYDPRTAFAAANTLTTTTSKDIVWVNVKVNQTFQGQTLYAGWNLISLN